MLRPGRNNTSLPSTTASASSYGNSGGYGRSSSDGGGYGTGSGYGSGESSYTNGGFSNSNYSGGGYSNNGGNSAYGGYAATASYGGADTSMPYKEKHRSGNKKNSSITMSHPLLTKLLKDPRTWPMVAAVLFLILTVRYKSQTSHFLKTVHLKSLPDAIRFFQSQKLEQDRLRRELKTMKDSYRKAVETSSQLEQEKRTLKKQVENSLSTEKAQTREQAWKNQVEVLQQATSRESRRAATEKYGPGPHFVEFTIQLPHMPEDQAERKFTVEMAPLESMPHAVHLFLEQVSHGLWNKAWFYINGPHVLQAGPQADETEMEEAIAAGEDERALALRPFRELQLDTLAFPEYSEDYPHVTWTLGFTGRPGGPDFYINKVDNTVAHGPGGQFHHELEEFADSCFAKVVKGFDTMNAMTSAPTVLENNEYQYFFEEPVYITNVVITEDPTPKLEVKASAAAGDDKPKEDSAAEETVSGEKPATDSKEGDNIKREPRKNRRKKKFKPHFDHQVEP